MKHSCTHATCVFIMYACYCCSGLSDSVGVCVGMTLSSRGHTRTEMHTHSFDSTMNRQVQSKSWPLFYSSDQYMDPHSHTHSSPGSADSAPKILLSKIRHLISSFVLSFPSLLPSPFTLHSRQPLSRRASHFPQILFSPFLLAVSVVFVSLVSHCGETSSTLIQNSTTGWIHRLIPCAVRALLVWSDECVLWKWKARRESERKFVFVTSFPGCLTEWVECLDRGGRCKALSHPSTDSHWSAKSNDSLASQYAAHIRIHANATAAVCVNTRTCRRWQEGPVTVISH